jgi:serine/threonine protein kinase
LTERSYGRDVLQLRQNQPAPFADEPSQGDLTPVVASFNEAASHSAPQELLESLERYKLVARLGQGGMAEVYLAAWEVAPFVHRPVVIKRLHPHFNEDTRLVQMFLDEARLLTQLDHPHVVKTLEAGVIDGRCCIAMEYLEGQPLHRVLRRAYQRGGLAPELAVSIAISVLDGLHYSHETTGADGRALEIVHRDVSPQNVFVTNDGQVKVLDFGIAKANTQEGRTATGIIKGKVGYIAPEQAAAEVVDRRADIWSVGVVLWEALAGARLFKAETDAATLGLCLQGEIPTAGSRRRDLPIELDVVLARALQRDRSLRYQTAGAMRKDLELWLARAGFSRDPRTIAALMRSLFSGEIVEQQRLVSVLMARSDCTPPQPASHRVPSSTSALIMSAPGAATSADLTRMNDQMAELGQRHRRAIRSVLALLALFVVIACVVGYFGLSQLRNVRPSTPAAAAARSSPPVNVNVNVPVPDLPSPIPSPTQPTSVLPKPLHTAAPRAVSSAKEPPESAPPAPSAQKPEQTAAFGYLSIDTSPWSLVSVGGRPLGQTPLMNLKLPVGSQVLSLKNPEQGIETSYPVTIESGKTTVRRIGIE